METATHPYQHEAKSLKHAWHHCKRLFVASAPSEAWQSLQQAFDALPVWALVLLPVLAAILVIKSALLLIPLAFVVFFWGTYATVKRAVADALRE